MPVDRNGKLIQKGKRARMRLANGTIVEGSVTGVFCNQTNVEGQATGAEKKRGIKSIFGRPHQEVTILD